MNGSGSSADFTRWNRAGLRRLQYVDGNAATFFELLRAELQRRFPDWQDMQSDLPAAESEAEWQERLQQLYGRDDDEILWQLSRSLARASHVLAGHLDAVANESSIGTATQWDSVRRLVDMLDYAPQPPASAYTPLALTVKDGLAGTLAAGFQVKHTPLDGGAPVLFETLADADVDYRLNTLRAFQHDRHPGRLGGDTLDLAGQHPKLVAGAPLLLENTETGFTAAYLIQGLQINETNDSTRISVSPALSRNFVRGATVVHAQPKDKLKPVSPAATGAEIGVSLQLSGTSGDLKAGEIVAVSAIGRKPVFRRLKQVYASRLIFFQELGDVDIASAAVSRPVSVPLTDLADKPQRREVRSDGTLRDVVFAAGDWSWLQGGWVAHQARVAGADLLPHYRVHKAKYVPVGTQNVADDEREGFTALTVDWHPQRDDVAGEQQLALNNPQYLLAVPRSTGPWASDTFLQKSDGRLDSPIVCEQGKHSAAGDHAVLVMGAQLAWGKLQRVDTDKELEQVALTPVAGWQERGGGPFYLSRTRAFAHFTEQLRVVDWNKNPSPLRGSQVPLNLEQDSAALALLQEGRDIILESGEASVQTRVRKLVNSTPPVLKLEHNVPTGSTRNNLLLSANVVDAGHGASRPERVLGSGDATRSNQQFLLDVEEVSWIADSSQASGVAAALEVRVAGMRWTQVANLRDSGPTDPVFTVRMDESARPLIGFGDGESGRRLPTGSNNVRVSYRQGVGAAGNLPPGSLEKAVKAHHLVDAVRQPLASAGGAQGESSSDMRDNAPATVLTLSRAVSVQDYAQLARAHASIWQARAFSLAPGFARRESIEVVVVPAGGGPLLPDLEATVHDFLRDNGLPGVALSVTAYEPVPLQFAITLRVDTQRHEPDEVSASVREALLDAFSLRHRLLGQPLYRGELYQVVESVTGVVNSSCLMSLAVPSGSLSSTPSQVLGRDGVVRVINPGPRQCLHLDIDEPQINISAERYIP